jgi:hypothetical protein
LLKHLAPLGLFALALAAAPTAQAQAIPGLPNATYQVSGTPGAYTLDFTVSNDLPAALNQNIYYFGIEPNVPITNSPSGWEPFDNANGHISLQAGSGIVYNTAWITNPSVVGITPGTALSGFEVTSVTAPTAVNFYAFVYDTTNIDTRIGYEGIATSAAAVPEASTTVSLGLLLVFGLGGLLVAAKRKKQSASS